MTEAPKAKRCRARKGRRITVSYTHLDVYKRQGLKLSHINVGNVSQKHGGVPVSYTHLLGVANESEVVETIRGMYESIMQADRDVQEVLDETEKKVNELINEE